MNPLRRTKFCDSLVLFQTRFSMFLACTNGTHCSVVRLLASGQLTWPTPSLAVVVPFRVISDTSHFNVWATEAHLWTGESTTTKCWQTVVHGQHPVHLFWYGPYIRNMFFFAVLGGRIESQKKDDILWHTKFKFQHPQTTFFGNTDTLYLSIYLSIYLSSIYLSIIYLSIIYPSFFFVLLEPHPWHMEVPRLGV